VRRFKVGGDLQRWQRRYSRVHCTKQIKPGSCKSVYFKNHDILTDAAPGENILSVAHRCGVDIPTGCLTGSCGTCEVEVTKQSSTEEVTYVARACVASVPDDGVGIVIDDIADQVWGVDGMDL